MRPLEPDCFAIYGTMNAISQDCEGMYNLKVRQNCKQRMSNIMRTTKYEDNKGTQQQKTKTTKVRTTKDEDNKGT